MRVTFLNDTIECTKADRGKDFIVLYSGEFIIAEFFGISDFSVFTIKDGDWTVAPLSEKEKIVLLEHENHQLQSKLTATIQSNQLLEDCLIEMADIVYG